VNRASAAAVHEWGLLRTPCRQSRHRPAGSRSLPQTPRHQRLHGSRGWRRGWMPLRRTCWLTWRCGRSSSMVGAGNGARGKREGRTRPACRRVAGGSPTLWQMGAEAGAEQVKAEAPPWQRPARESKLLSWKHHEDGGEGGGQRPDPPSSEGQRQQGIGSQQPNGHRMRWPGTTIFSLQRSGLLRIPPRSGQGAHWHGPAWPEPEHAQSVRHQPCQGRHSGELRPFRLALPRALGRCSPAGLAPLVASSQPTAGPFRSWIQEMVCAFPPFCTMLGRATPWETIF